jgi:hypothetical protein
MLYTRRELGKLALAFLPLAGVLKAVLQLLKKEQYGFPANIEWEPSLPIPADSSLVGEIKKALAYCKGCLA